MTTTAPGLAEIKAVATSAARGLQHTVEDGTAEVLEVLLPNPEHDPKLNQGSLVAARRNAARAYYSSTSLVPPR